LGFCKEFLLGGVLNFGEEAVSQNALQSKLLFPSSVSFADTFSRENTFRNAGGGVPYKEVRFGGLGVL